MAQAVRCLDGQSLLCQAKAGQNMQCPRNQNNSVSPECEIIDTNILIYWHWHKYLMVFLYRVSLDIRMQGNWKSFGVLTLATGSGQACKSGEFSTDRNGSSFKQLCNSSLLNSFSIFSDILVCITQWTLHWSCWIDWCLLAGNQWEIRDEKTYSRNGLPSEVRVEA